MSFVQESLFGEDFHPLNAWLDERFDEVDARSFYRELFPEGALAKQGEIVDGLYRGVAVRIKNGHARRFSINDGLEILDRVERASEDEFWLASPVSYAGRTQKQEMARHLYALAIDLDGVRVNDPLNPHGLGAMWNQMVHEILPIPTYIVSSGSGLHFYYMLDEPIALYRSVVRQLQEFRRDLITRIWNSYITTLWERPQYEAVTQGFRMVGTYTKQGKKVRAWRVGNTHSIEILSMWSDHPVTDVHYKSELSLAQAKEKYPDWYQRRIVENKPRGSWIVKPALYEWWRDKKINEARIGHRYFYLMALAIYAVKCGISEEQLHADAWKAATILRVQDRPENRLSDEDVVKALEMYNASYQTFPRKSIQGITGIPMPPNKRNYRKQDLHLRGARAVQEILNEANGTNWRENSGRPSGSSNKSYPKRDAIKAWRAENPNGSKIECERATGISRPTVLKWWDA